MRSSRGCAIEMHTTDVTVLEYRLDRQVIWFVQVVLVASNECGCVIMWELFEGGVNFFSLDEHSHAGLIPRREEIKEVWYTCFTCLLYLWTAATNFVFSDSLLLLCRSSTVVWMSSQSTMTFPKSAGQNNFLYLTCFYLLHLACCITWLCDCVFPCGADLQIEKYLVTTHPKIFSCGMKKQGITVSSSVKCIIV